jgi:hypothetical protein
MICHYKRKNDRGLQILWRRKMLEKEKKKSKIMTEGKYKQDKIHKNKS